MSNSGPCYSANPDHRIELLRETRRVVVRVKGEIIADSSRTIALHLAFYGHEVDAIDVA